MSFSAAFSLSGLPSVPAREMPQPSVLTERQDSVKRMYVPPSVPSCQRATGTITAMYFSPWSACNFVAFRIVCVWL